mmetsp:Transcript_93626/g.261956  ORF Transcript_93626/g.261956 Transcript_93626/m.261956 type:complete len:292 (-) Transcript_93626:2-877(-)
MDDVGVALLLRLLDAVPHLRDPRACCVDDLHAPRLQQGHLVDARAEGGQKDHVTLLHPRKVLAAALHRRDELHAHRLQLCVHRGVVDDLVGAPDVLVGEEVPRLVGHSHGALDAPAKAVGIRKDKGDVADSEAEAVLAQLRHQLAAAHGHQLLPRVVHLALAELVVVLRPLEIAAELLGRIPVHGRQHGRGLGGARCSTASGPALGCRHGHSGGEGHRERDAAGAAGGHAHICGHGGLGQELGGGRRGWRGGQAWRRRRRDEVERHAGADAARAAPCLPRALRAGQRRRTK